MQSDRCSPVHGNAREDVYDKLGSGLLEVGNEVSTLLLLLDGSSSHLGALDVLLGVLDVVEQSLLAPKDTSITVGLGVGVPLGSSRHTSEKPVQVGPSLVDSSLIPSQCQSQ